MSQGQPINVKSPSSQGDNHQTRKNRNHLFAVTYPARTGELRPGGNEILPPLNDRPRNRTLLQNSYVRAYCQRLCVSGVSQNQGSISRFCVMLAAQSMSRSSSNYMTEFQYAYLEFRPSRHAWEILHVTDISHTRDIHQRAVESQSESGMRH